MFIFTETVPESIDIKDLYRRLPFLEKTIREEDRKTIEVYVTEKVCIDKETGFYPSVLLKISREY